MKLTINKLIANDMINYGMDKTSSFNYIVSLNSYLEEYDEESQKYIKENLDDIKDDIERNECVADLVVEKNDDDIDFNMVFYWGYLLTQTEKIVYENIDDLMNLENLELNYNLGSSLDNTKSALSKLYDKVYKIIKNNNEKILETNCKCIFCRNRLKVSDLIDYEYVCENCDENFYYYEVTDENAWYKKGKGGVEILNEKSNTGNEL